MRKITVDAMGETCPIPVVKTKEAIRALGNEPGVVEIQVDNEVAVQNLMKMANIKGYEGSFSKNAENDYTVRMIIG